MNDNVTTTDSPDAILPGKFQQMLQRSTKQITADRSHQIIVQTQKKFTRALEDVQDQIEGKKIKRNNMLDMSPTETTKLINPNDFNPDDFYNMYIELGVEILKLEERERVLVEAIKDLF